MSLKFITAEEAAAFVNNDDNVGFSGFTPAGCPKSVPEAIAKEQLKSMPKATHFRSECLPELLPETD